MAFHNTLIKETLTKYAPTVLTVTTHNHPLIPLGHLPLIIINQSEIISGSRIKDLVKSLAMRSNKENLLVEPILLLSEELGTAIQFLSEKTSNPYYMLISPFKKLEFHLWRKKMQAQF